MRQLRGLAMMPGDLGDARLNNYFLENVYQFFAGNSDSLWHLGFFAPFPYTLGFSDNLFGSVPVYLIARFLMGKPDTAYQIWFLVGFAVNYGAAYYALRRLSVTRLAATLGALIFSFALPTTAQAMHAQLHYRFGVPLSATFLILFIVQKDFTKLAVSGAWLTWQFYCSIYVGFFLLLLLGTGCAVHFSRLWIFSDATLRDIALPFVATWRARSNGAKVRFLAALAFLAIAMVLLFYPYLEVSRLYHLTRTWPEISLMLPRPQSYFLSDYSYFWSFPSAEIFEAIPMRHEHQMFMGVLPLLLALVGLVLGWRGEGAQKSAFMVLAGGLVGVVTITLSIGGYSIWYLLHAAPLASAIRAMSRLDQVLLFPMAFLSSLGTDLLSRRWPGAIIFIALVVIPMIILEQSATSMSVSAKQVWRDRVAAAESRVLQPDQNSVLFFAQKSGPDPVYGAQEIDAMWASLRLGFKTINGYSGNAPPGYSFQPGDDCAELPRRIQSYLTFANKGDDAIAYRELMNSVVPIGFNGCDPAWQKIPPPPEDEKRKP